MNENYLWNKTGADPEIEKMENALKALRATQNTIAPPIFPAVVIEKKSPFNFFQLVIPALACLIITVLASGLWLANFSERSSETAKKSVSARNSVPTFDEPTKVSVPISDGAKRKQIEEKAERRMLRKLRKPRPFYVRPSSTTAQRDKAGNPSEVLTKEEKYAYDQLMTALTITSSQLKLVRDKIQNAEDRTAAIESER